MPADFTSDTVAGCASGTGAPQVTPDATSAQVAPDPAKLAAVQPEAPRQADDTVEVRRNAPTGYRVATHDGELVYCKSTTTLGSRLKKEVCMTPEQHKDLEQTSERNRQELKKSIGMCDGSVGFGACNGG